MKDIKKLNSKCEDDFGTYIIHAEGKEEIHIYLPYEGGITEESKNIRKSIIKVAEEKIGPITKKEKDYKKDLSSGWPHYRSWEYISGDEFQLSILEEERYVGVAGEYEQIIFALQVGVASGVAGAITTTIISYIKRLYANRKNNLTPDKKIEKAEKLLKKRFGVVGDVEYEEIKQDNSKTYLRVIDDQGKRFELTIDTETEAFLISIKPLQ